MLLGNNNFFTWFALIVWQSSNIKAILKILKMSLYIYKHYHRYFESSRHRYKSKNIQKNFFYLSSTSQRIGYATSCNCNFLIQKWQSHIEIYFPIHPAYDIELPQFFKILSQLTSWNHNWVTKWVISLIWWSPKVVSCL